MLTIEQIRAARALLDWSQSDLADHAGLSQTGIARIENGTNQPNTKTLEKILGAFDNADIEFIGTSGVKKREGNVRTLRGQKGFNTFINDVYEFAKTQGGEICVSNVDERDFDKWFGDVGEEYLAGMKKLGEAEKVKSRILVREGDTHLIASGYAKYKCLPEENFGGAPFYVYANKMAIILFSEDDVSIHVIDNKEIADGQRKQFNIAWRSAKPL